MLLEATHTTYYWQNLEHIKQIFLHLMTSYWFEYGRLPHWSNKDKGEKKKSRPRFVHEKVYLFYFLISIYFIHKNILVNNKKKTIVKIMKLERILNVIFCLIIFVYALLVSQRHICYILWWVETCIET